MKKLVDLESQVKAVIDTVVDGIITIDAKGVSKPLRVLIIEDSEEEAQLVVRELRHAGWEVAFERVETPEAMAAALERESWDLFVSDYRMPRFRAPEALALYQERGLDAPFIVVSGTIGEEQAVEVMKAGAHDFFIKDRLTRFAAAVERELREAGSRRTRRSLARAIEQAPLSVVLTDAEGRIEYVNPAFTTTTGYTLDEARGQTPRLLKSSVHDAAFYASLWQTIRAGREWRGEIVNQRKDGSHYVQELSVSPLSLGGRIDGFVAIGTDITERRREQDALREADARLIAVIENTGDLIWSVDPSHRLLTANTAFRRTLAQAIGREIRVGQSVLAEGFPAETLREWKALYDRALAGEKLVQEMSAQDESGSTRCWENSLNPIRDGGHVVGVAAVSRDVTERRKGERELRLARESLDRSGDLVAWSDREGRLVYVNETMAKTLGYPREELVGTWLWEVVPSISPQTWPATWEAVRRAGSARFDNPLRRKDGSVFPTEATVSHLRVGDYELQCAVVRDVSERTQAVETLRRSEEKYRLLVDHIQEIVFAGELAGGASLENPLHFISRQTKAILGLDPEAFLDRGDLWSSLIHPEDVAPLRQVTERAFAAGRPVRREYRLRHAQTGEYRWIEDILVPELDGGRVTGFFGTARDTTERRRAEDALRLSEANLRGAFEHAAIGMALVAPDGRWLQVNPALCALVGYSQAELLARTFQEITYPDDLDADLGQVRRMLAGEIATYQRETRYLQRSGAVVWVLLSVSLVRDAEGHPLYFISQIQDITGRKLAEERQSQAEQMLRQSQKMEAIGRLAGGIAHDFNNVLGVITGFGELAKRQLPPDHPVQGRLEQILKASGRAADLTRHMLAFSRKQVMHPRALALNAVIEGTRKMLGRLIGEDVELVLRLDPQLGTVMADPTQVDQVLMNLAVNARDAMPQGGTLSFETANVELGEDYVRRHLAGKPGSYVMLAVSDTGIGMDEETRSHIFEPFFTTKAEGKGTGLGLATVYGIVKQSDGFIWVYSEPGHGATFKIYLPRLDAPQETDIAAPGAAEMPRGTETILVAEDQEALRQMIREVLEQQGYTVLAAADGSAALELARRHGGLLHLLLTDVVMPGMNGRELAERLAVERPGVPALYMSGYTDGTISDRGLIAADVRLVEKPFTATSLAQAVRKALDQR